MKHVIHFGQTPPPNPHPSKMIIFANQKRNKCKQNWKTKSWKMNYNSLEDEIWGLLVCWRWGGTKPGASHFGSNQHSSNQSLPVSCWRGWLNKHFLRQKCNSMHNVHCAMPISLVQCIRAPPGAGLQNSLNPTIPDWRTWSKFGEHG